jgi:hypothetical protein
MKKTPKEITLVVHAIDQVFPPSKRLPFALGCLAVDIETGQPVKALIKFNYDELTFVLENEKTLKESKA